MAISMGFAPGFAGCRRHIEAPTEGQIQIEAVRALQLSRLDNFRLDYELIGLEVRYPQEVTLAVRVFRKWGSTCRSPPR
jgi:hypothetical protein